LVEDDIKIDDFPHQAKVRNLELEYKLLKLITETSMHRAELVEGELSSGQVNRYSDVLPYKNN
jgi:hypothetical protein